MSRQFSRWSFKTMYPFAYSSNNFLEIAMASIAFFAKRDDAGGKGTWGTDADSHLDHNDPNYDSEEEPYQLVSAAVSASLEDYKKRVVSIIEEYFSTDDVASAATDLKDLGCPTYDPYSNSRGNEIVHMARALLAARHAGERILRCWGGGTGWAVEDAKDKISKLLEEYETGGDLKEACKCIRDLDMPFFHHEVVKKALVMAMEKKNDRLLDLLQECSTEGLITINQMMKGFIRVADSLDDLSLDIPNAKDKFLCYVEQAKGNGWLVSSFAFSSNSDPGQSNGIHLSA